MLKSYKEFLNENNINHNVSIGEVSESIDKSLGEFNESSSSNTYMSSFSTIVLKEGERLNEIDQFIDNKIIELDKEFGRKTITYLVKELVRNKRATKYGRENGAADIIFNKYYSDFPLGGYVPSEDSNMFIKYEYGWQHTKYGKMSILQDFNTVKEFSNNAITKYLENYLSEVGNNETHIQYEGLILDLTVSDDYRLLGDPEKQEYDVKSYYKDDALEIYEILNSDNETIATSDDWLKFFDKCLDEKIGINAPWKEILKERGVTVDLDNYVSSKIGISKYDL